MNVQIFIICIVFFCMETIFLKNRSARIRFLFLTKKKRLFKSRLNRHMNETANESGQSNIRYN